MHRSVWWVLLALFSMPAAATGVSRPELAAGRSMAVVVHSATAYLEAEPAGLTDAVRQRLVAELAKRKRFRIVDEPSRADLVCLYVMYAPRLAERRGKTFTTTVGSSVIILKGGTDERWDAAPLWMNTTLEQEWTGALPRMVGWLHRDLAKGRNQQPRPPVTQEAGEGLKVFLTCPDSYSCAKPEEFLPAAAPHWTRVEDPQRADYVVVWFRAAMLDYQPIGLGSWLFSGFLLFDGRAPAWEATPLAVAYRPELPELREPLEKMIAYLANPRAAASVLDADFGSVLPPPDPRTPRFPPQPGRSVIYIVREDNPLGKTVGIAVDGETVFDMRPLTAGRLTVDPGSHTITAKEGQTRGELLLSTEAGEVYFVTVRLQFGRLALDRVGYIDPDRVPQVLDWHVPP